MSLVLERAASHRSRWQREDLGGGVRFRIPTRKRWFVILPATIWLLIWAVAEGDVIGQIREKQVGTAAAIGPIWLAFWTLAGFFVLGIFLWQLIGETTIEVSGGKLRYRLGFGSLAIGRTYDGQLIRNLRASRVELHGDDLILWRNYFTVFFGWGLLRFDYGDRAVTIRPDLEPTEANNLANALNQYLPYGQP
jgi:hypothetical protein